MSTRDMRIGELLDEMTRTIGEPVDMASKDAAYILSELLSVSVPELALAKGKVIGGGLRETALSLARRRASNEPLQHLFHRAYFRELELKIGPDVLIPRPETEILVDLVKPWLFTGAEVCDMGTGSGAIGLSIAKEHPECRVTLVDVSEKALRIAAENAETRRLDNVDIVKSDLFESLKSVGFDVIAANLPYVSAKEFQTLPLEVKRHDPKGALVGGVDGLDVIRRCIAQAHTFLSSRGMIIMEMGERQAGDVIELLNLNGNYQDIRVEKDLNGKDRFVTAAKQKNG